MILLAKERENSIPTNLDAILESLKFYGVQLNKDTVTTYLNNSESLQKKVNELIRASVLGNDLKVLISLTELSLFLQLRPDTLVIEVAQIKKCISKLFNLIEQEEDTSSETAKYYLGALMFVRLSISFMPPQEIELMGTTVMKLIKDFSVPNDIRYGLISLLPDMGVSSTEIENIFEYLHSKNMMSSVILSTVRVKVMGSIQVS